MEFRSSRRKKREISVDMAEKLLITERRGVFAVNGDGGYPYAIPINYVYDKANQKIYFHGAKIGHKVDSLKNSDKVCFTVYGNEAIKEEEWAPFVQSVVIFGRCSLIGEAENAEAKLRLLAEKYYPDEDSINEEIGKYGKAVQMYEITIEHMSGKEIQEK